MGQPEKLFTGIGPARLPDRGRSAEDDFYCLRFDVWYPSFDCAVRTRYNTCRACMNCDQGRFNLKRHAEALGRIRFHYDDR